jgi:hypothetical protein
MVSSQSTNVNNKAIQVGKNAANEISNIFSEGRSFNSNDIKNNINNNIPSNKNKINDQNNKDLNNIQLRKDKIDEILIPWSQEDTIPNKQKNTDVKKKSSRGFGSFFKSNLKETENESNHEIVEKQIIPEISNQFDIL